VEAKMPVFAVDVATKTIVVFNAASISAAESAVFEANGLAEDWTVLESEGSPIWNGNEHITVREATPFEYNRWQASRSRARESGENVDDEGMVHVVYLVPRDFFAETL
jgi:hypothetical protein